MCYIIQYLKKGLSQWSQNTQPQACTSFKFSYFQAPQSLRLRNKTCTYKADCINATSLYMWKRKGHEGNPGTNEVMERSWAEIEIILKTTRMFENLEVTRKYTYNTKSKSEQVTLVLQAGIPPLGPAGQMVRLWEGSEHICKSASTFSINVLDALIWPKDSQSSKSRCPGLNLPTLGWCMCITCVFYEMNTWCCQPKQANTVGLREATQTWIVLPKTINTRCCTGEINPTLWTDHFKAKYFFKKILPFTSIFVTIQNSIL